MTAQHFPVDIHADIEPQLEAISKQAAHWPAAAATGCKSEVMNAAAAAGSSGTSGAMSAVAP